MMTGVGSNENKARNEHVDLTHEIYSLVKPELRHVLAEIRREYLRYYYRISDSSTDPYKLSDEEVLEIDLGYVSKELEKHSSNSLYQVAKNALETLSLHENYGRMQKKVAEHKKVCARSSYVFFAAGITSLKKLEEVKKSNPMLLKALTSAAVMQELLDYRLYITNDFYHDNKAKGLFTNPENLKHKSLVNLLHKAEKVMLTTRMRLSPKTLDMQEVEKNRLDDILNALIQRNIQIEQYQIDRARDYSQGITKHHLLLDNPDLRLKNQDIVSVVNFALERISGFDYIHQSLLAGVLAAFPERENLHQQVRELMPDVCGYHQLVNDMGDLFKKKNTGQDFINGDLTLLTSVSLFANKDEHVYIRSLIGRKEPLQSKDVDALLDIAAKYRIFDFFEVLSRDRYKTMVRIVDGLDYPEKEAVSIKERLKEQFYLMKDNRVMREARRRGLVAAEYIIEGQGEKPQRKTSFKVSQFLAGEVAPATSYTKATTAPYMALCDLRRRENNSYTTPLEWLVKKAKAIEDPEAQKTYYQGIKELIGSKDVRLYREDFIKEAFREEADKGVYFEAYEQIHHIPGKPPKAWPWMKEEKQMPPHLDKYPSFRKEEKAKPRFYRQ